MILVWNAVSFVRLIINISDFWLFRVLKQFSTYYFKTGAEHYKWKMDECMGLEVDGTGIYYPDWTGDNEACLNDRNEPQYMVQNPSIWMFSTLDECCEKYYSYNLATCTGASASTGTTKFWIRWSDKKCVQDCVGPSPCGGIAESWDTKYNTKAECCKENMSYDRRECINAD